MNPKSNNIAELNNLIREAKEMQKMQEEIYLNSISESGIDPDKLMAFIAESGKTYEEMKETIESEEGKEFVDSMWSAVVDKNASNCNEESEIKDVLISALDTLVDLKESANEMKELEEEANQEIEGYISYLNSPEFEQAMCNKRESFVAEIQKEKEKESPNLHMIRELEKKIQVIDDRYTLGFLFRSKVSLDNAVKAFFDDQKSNYALNKYIDKCKQAGINPQCFKYFFNLEETFLDEKYHPFNNFILFTCIRHIGYCDVKKDIDQIKTCINSLHKLFYNKFASEELRNQLITSISKYLDQFIDAGYTEKFVEENTTWKQHPNRIEKEKKREEEARKKIYSILLDEHYIENISEVEDLSIEELHAFLNNKNAEKINRAARAGSEQSLEDEVTADLLEESKNPAEDKPEISEIISE